MSETSKTETNNQNPLNGILDNLLNGQGKDIFNLLNQPVIANSALGLILYKVLDPAGTKSKLDKLLDMQKEMIEVLLIQSKELEKLRKKVSRLSELMKSEDPTETASENRVGRNTGKLSGNSYLD